MGEIKLKGNPYVGEKVRLRPYELSDVESIMEHWNTYKSRRFLGTFTPHSSLQEEDFIRMQVKWADEKRAFAFVITDKNTGAFIGGTGCHEIDWINRSTTVGIAIHNPENLEKGYGSDALRCVLKFCFNILNLNRVELGVYEFNTRAIHVYEKVG
ncbi:MAG: GNAT family N-acetyltransferase, partial [Candidatus Hodarchaeota archaeon]